MSAVLPVQCLARHIAFSPSALFILRPALNPAPFRFVPEVFLNPFTRQLTSHHSSAEWQETKVTPFRKELKDRKAYARNGDKITFSPVKGSTCVWDETAWELTVGIEIHAQLNTERKLFSTALTAPTDTPNTHVSFIDAALPGCQPDFQKDAVLPALRAALALGCQIQRVSHFDRKHYFYRDQPAGYQITQYSEPYARDGEIILQRHDGIASEDGDKISIGIKQIQLEQDTAKSLQQTPSSHLLDYNRVSYPLIEIISLPQIHHPSTAAAYVRKVQAILEAVGACTLGMERGGLRADVNVSVRPRTVRDGSDVAGSHGQGLGQRTEIKNLSSFKAVEEAITAERDRQVALLTAGGAIRGETRGWTLGGVQTTKLREKEGEVDYRYLPDPDLAPLVISNDAIQIVKSTLPVLPDQLTEFLVTSADHKLTLKDAKTLVALNDGERLNYYETVRVMLKQRLQEDFSSDDMTGKQIGRTTANWVLHELGGLLAASEVAWDDNPVSATMLVDVLTHLNKNEVTGRTAKHLLRQLVASDARSTKTIIQEEGLLLRPMSAEEYERLARIVLRQHEALVYKLKTQKKSSKVSFLVGQMMRQGEEGRVEARKAQAVLQNLLDKTK